LRITIHGDYDVDGVCSTAILVRTLRALGADVDWYLPSRLEDGYGLSSATVTRLAERGTRLLVTVDCAITAVDEVAAARAAGLEVVVTDHHSPRADGRLPDAPIVHPALCGYPCQDLCATGVAHKLASALFAAAETDPARADEDLDLVALATVADVVALRGENRRLVREGLRVLAGTRRPGLRALMRVAKLDPGAVDARAVGFRLAPRINAAGRLYRADAGLELLLTEDERRADEVAQELDRANAERRHTETRILFEAEAMLAEHERAVGPDQPAYVLAGEGWHPGVIGIVAARIAERHHRPTVLIALDAPPAEARGVGSGRSIPAFDLLAGLDACTEHLVRHGGHRAAAGLEIEASRIEDFRASFTAHAGRVLGPRDLQPVERVDAVAAGDELGLGLAEELGRLAPFGQGNPDVSLLLPAAILRDSQPIGEGKHVRFTVEAGGARARAVAFGGGGRLPVPCDEPVDATFALELNEYRGAVEPRLVLRRARPCQPEPIECLGEPASYLDGVWTEFDAELDEAGLEAASCDPGPPAPGCVSRDRRGGGIAGTIGALVASGEPVLVLCADASRRLEHLRGRIGGFALCSYAVLERNPSMAAPYSHLVALDPPARPTEEALLHAGARGQTTHLAWGEPELRFAQNVHEHEYGLRSSLSALYRPLRAAGSSCGEALEAALRGDGAQARSPALAGRVLRVLSELGLVHLDRERSRVTVPAAQRTELERSGAFRVYDRLLQEGQRFLSQETARAA
jgi:single-stranded-DNA-specific exonuclease